MNKKLTTEQMKLMMQNPDCPFCQSAELVTDFNCNGCNIRHLTRSLPRHRSDYFKKLKARGDDLKPHQEAMLAIRDWDKKWWMLR